MRNTVVLGLATVLLGACEKGVATKAPPSTVDADRLWALAPSGATQGLVASPRALASIEGAWIAIEGLLASGPEMAQPRKEITDRLVAITGTASPRLATFGMAPTAGFAMFGTAEAPLAIVLPVVDRAAFRAAVKGTQDGDLDVVGELRCKPVRDVYACAKDVAVLATLGQGELSGLRARLPARGDVEGAFTIPEEAIDVAGVLQVSRGAFTMRLAMRGLPAEVIAALGSARPRVEAGRTSGFAMLDPRVFASRAPAFELVPGVRADELLRTITGAVSLTVGGRDRAVFDVRAPLSDPALATRFVGACASFPPFVDLGARADGPACVVPVAPLQTEATLKVEGSELRILTAGAPARDPVELTPLGTELASTPWAFAVWGRGTSFAFAAPNPGAADNSPPMAKAAMRALAMLSEIGGGVRRDDDTVHAVLGVRTAWSNPDDVVAKLLAIPAGDVLTGAAGPTAKAIAAAAPRTPFAQDVAAGTGGLLIQTSLIGMSAAVAIPTFIQYMERSRANAAPPPGGPTRIMAQPPR